MFNVRAVFLLCCLFEHFDSRFLTPFSNGQSPADTLFWRASGALVHFPSCFRDTEKLALFARAAFCHVVSDFTLVGLTPSLKTFRHGKCGRVLRRGEIPSAEAQWTFLESLDAQGSVLWGNYP